MASTFLKSFRDTGNTIRIKYRTNLQGRIQPLTIVAKNLHHRR